MSGRLPLFQDFAAFAGSFREESMHRFESLVLALVVFPSAPSGARGGITFVGPLTILDVPRPVTVHAGDFDNDGKKDLIVSNGTDTVFVLFQNSTNRAEWQAVPLRVGSSTFFTRAGDFDGDGFDDLLAGDNASAAYLVRSNGDQTFAQPQPIVAARGPRWVATGDWDKDGNLDFASSNLSTATLTIFLGDGAGGFNLSQEVGGAREHTLEGLDYDGDGKLDLALGTGLPGIILYKGAGNGTFRVGGNVPNLGCIEYIATGDFNNDGKSDLATTCIDDQNAYAGISVGNGTYKQTLKTPFASGTESAAIADLDGDQIQDLALVSNGSCSLRSYLSNGDGTFQPPVDYGPTGSKPVFLIAQDLDGDGHQDVISADTDSSTLTVFFGREGERF